MLMRKTPSGASIFLAGVLSLVLLNRDAHGALIMTLDGTPSSSIVNFSLSGSDVATKSFGAGIHGMVFRISDGFDPFPPSINGSDFGEFLLQSGSGTLTNTTTSTSDAIASLFLQDISLFGFAERFGVGTVSGYTLSAGDVFTWAGSGTIDLSGKGLTFGDLTLGSGVGFLDLPGPGNVGVDGVLNIVSQAVPEPSTLFLLGTGLVGLVGYTRRKASPETWDRSFVL